MTDSPSEQQRTRTRLVRSCDVFRHFYDLLDGKPMPRAPPTES